MALRVALVAAEPSGDQLGAALMRELQRLHPDMQFIGIGGDAMQQQGLRSRYPMEQLSIMGLIEILPHLLRLLRLRRALARWLIEQQPDVFIGIDAPDFNLGLAQMLKQHSIKTIHYVSPTVWAWKEGRVKTLKRAIDQVLCLFPFEVEFLRRHAVQACYVGHPLADSLPLEPDRQAARQRLGLPETARVLALLPGSRRAEVERLAVIFLDAALLLQASIGPLKVVVPLVNQLTRDLFEKLALGYRDKIEIHILSGDAGIAMTAADAVLLASGTATLQGLLCHRPMVVGYRVNPVTYWLTRLLRLIKIPYVAMANLLSGDMLAPEFLQNKCKPEPIAAALQRFFTEPDSVAQISAQYRQLHLELRCNAANTAAQVVLVTMTEV